MTRARALTACAALALLFACGEDKVTPLKAELEKLKKERVPQEQLETAKREAAESEAMRDAAVAKATTDEASVESAKAELERLRNEMQRETDRNLELRKQIDENVDKTNASASGVEALDKQVAERRKRLGVLRDQAKALARALQPQDPAWAETRRLAALRDFAGDAESQLPSQPEVQALVRALAQSPPERETLVTVLQKLAEALDRVAEAGATEVGAK
ncbi:MAG TPA: hypothetical protein VMR50_02350 [Myxococcota bacterium]|nr:hypothetical protein [Myxococcota bacterium]